MSWVQLARTQWCLSLWGAPSPLLPGRSLRHTTGAHLVVSNLMRMRSCTREWRTKVMGWGKAVGFLEVTHMYAYGQPPVHILQKTMCIMYCMTILSGQSGPAKHNFSQNKTRKYCVLAATSMGDSHKHALKSNPMIHNRTQIQLRDLSEFWQALHWHAVQNCMTDLSWEFLGFWIQLARTPWCQPLHPRRRPSREMSRITTGGRSMVSSTNTHREPWSRKYQKKPILLPDHMSSDIMDKR